MAEMTSTTPVYTAIPPTSDLNYWQVKRLDNKTQLFTPIDTELHRQLLIGLKTKRTPRYELPVRKRYNPRFS